MSVSGVEVTSRADPAPVDIGQTDDAFVQWLPDGADGLFCRWHTQRMINGCLEAAVALVRVVVVDDQPDVRLLLRIALDQPSEGLEVVGDAPDAMSAIATIDETRPDVVILDHMMPGTTGIELAGQLRSRWPDLVIILCSAWITDELRVQAREAGIQAAVNKTSISELPAMIRALTARIN